MPPIFTGCATALITPFRGGDVDYNALKRLIDFQIDSGIKALVLCGTTGEAPTLTSEEKRRIIAFSAEKSQGRAKIIAGCGSPSTAYAVQSAENAQKDGADAVLCVTPYYNKASDTGLYLHYREIAEAVTVPIIGYNVPSRTGMSISPQSLNMLCEIPNFCGIKEASGDIKYAEKILSDMGKRLYVWSGCDELISPMYSIGGSGVISVLSNIMPRRVSELCEKCEKGDLSCAKSQLELLPIISALFSEVNPIPVKTALHIMGLCSLEFRLPLCRMKDKTEKLLREELKKGL